MSENGPSKIFQYPDCRKGHNDTRMCHDGKVRAAEYGRQLLNNEVTAEDVRTMAHKGEYAVGHGADTQKRNLIAFVVYYLFHIGKLDEYVNKEGDFLIREGKLANLKDYDDVASRFRRR